MKYIVNCDKRINLVKPEETCSFPVFVRFVGEFSEENISKFRSNLIDAENQAMESEQDVIPISIDSYGGEVYSLLAAIDAIEDLKTRFKVATIVEGKAMSCGSILFTCGTEGYRFMGPNATLMIHDVSHGRWAKIEEMKVSTKEADRLNDKVYQLMSKNCGHKKDYFQKLMYENKHADLFLDAEEAKKHNLTNHIGIPRYHVDIKMDVKFLF